VLWGAIHGLLLIMHRLLSQLVERWPRVVRFCESLPGQIMGVGSTFLCVSLCWVLFRSQTFFQAKCFYVRLLKPNAAGLPVPLPLIGLVVAVSLLVVGHALGQGSLGKKIVERMPAPVMGMAYGLALAVTLLLAPPSGQPFIYFQF
jgi:alginate O-acetyltransferase complex protein AlgI